jgi:hypothetical protein
MESLYFLLTLKADQALIICLRHTCIKQVLLAFVHFKGAKS